MVCMRAAVDDSSDHLDAQPVARVPIVVRPVTQRSPDTFEIRVWFVLMSMNVRAAHFAISDSEVASNFSAVTRIIACPPNVPTSSLSA